MSCKVKSGCTSLSCDSNQMLIEANKEVFGEDLAGLKWTENLPVKITSNGDLEIPIPLGAEGMSYHLSDKKVHFEALVNLYLYRATVTLELYFFQNLKFVFLTKISFRWSRR